MTLAIPDRSFGNQGTLWSGVPLPFDYIDATGMTVQRDRYVGGTAMAAQVLSNGVLALVVSGVDDVGPQRPGALPTGLPAVRIVRIPADGQPQEAGWSEGTQVDLISEPDGASYPLASSATFDNHVAVLIGRYQLNVWSFAICTFAAVTQLPIVTRAPVDPIRLFSPPGSVPEDAMRMAADGADFVVVSSKGTRIRVAQSVGPLIRDVDLVNTPALPGLVRVEVDSVRFSSGRAIIAFTAHLNHPSVGATSLGAVLRLLSDGSRDSHFGDNGLWVSPVTPGLRGFIGAGEVDGFVAGCVGSRAVVFAVDQNGGGLDPAFGAGGIADHDLGGHLASPVTTSDDLGVYVFAQRMRSRTNPGGDGHTAGCRIPTTRGAIGYGLVDPGWGDSGKMVINADGAPLTPAAVMRHNARLYVAGTRRLLGTNCDRIPVVTALAAANAAPDPGFGAGGFSLHASIKKPAAVASDGSAVFAERVLGQQEHALRFVTPTGAVGRLVPLSFLPSTASITGISYLSDGSLVLAGGEGGKTWVLRLDAAGVPDPTFGVDGMVNPKPGSDGFAKVLGPLSRERVAVRVDGLGKSFLTVLRRDGQVDTGYGAGGSVELLTFTHGGPTGPDVGPSETRCFLADDESVISVVSSDHEPTKLATQSPYVTVGLRRITSDGMPDSNFGLGAASVFAAPGRLLRLPQPVGAQSSRFEYKKVVPSGISWMGGQLYVFATAYSGGAVRSVGGFSRTDAEYPLVIVMRWNADGSIDGTFGRGGWQEAGFDPEMKLWSVHGAFQESPTSAVLYGAAGEMRPPPISSTVPRQPQPALFLVKHPTGIDMGFGGDGSATFRLPEVMLTPVAGALLSNRRVRLACIDLLPQTDTAVPRSNQGGLVQWRLRDPRPPRPHPP